MKIKNLLVEDGFIEELLRDLNKQEDSYVLIDYDICKELHTKTGIYRLFLVDYASKPIMLDGEDSCLNYYVNENRRTKKIEKIEKQIMYEELFDATESSIMPFLMPIDSFFKIMTEDDIVVLSAEILSKEEDSKYITINSRNDTIVVDCKIVKPEDLIKKLEKNHNQKIKKERPGYKVLKKKDYKRNRKANILGCMSGRNYGSNKLSD